MFLMKTVVIFLLFLMSSLHYGGTLAQKPVGPLKFHRFQSFPRSKRWDVACQRRFIAMPDVASVQNKPETAPIVFGSDSRTLDSIDSSSHDTQKNAKMPLIDIDYRFTNHEQTIHVQFSFPRRTLALLLTNSTTKMTSPLFEYAVQYVKMDDYNSTMTTMILSEDNMRTNNHYGDAAAPLQWKRFKIDIHRYEHYESNWMSFKRWMNDKKDSNGTALTNGDDDDGGETVKNPKLVPILHLRLVVVDVNNGTVKHARDFMRETTMNGVSGGDDDGEVDDYGSEQFYDIGPVITFEDRGKFNRSECYDLDNVLFYHRAFNMQDIRLALALHTIFFVPIFSLFMVTILTSRGRLAKRRSPTSIMGSLSIFIVFSMSLCFVDSMLYVYFRKLLYWNPLESWVFIVLVVTVLVFLNLAVSCYMATMVSVSIQ